LDDQNDCKDQNDFYPFGHTPDTINGMSMTLLPARKPLHRFDAGL
jgi:hypothetical protein